MGAAEPVIVGDVRDPYPLFAEMRRTQPSRAHASGTQFHMVFRRADCDRVLRDAEGLLERIVADTMEPTMGRTILEVAAHLRHRGLISVAFRPHRSPSGARLSSSPPYIASSTPSPAKEPRISYRSSPHVCRFS
jgi:cytochrome P450